MPMRTGAPPPPPDDATHQVTRSLGYTPRVVRHPPQLTWTDAKSGQARTLTGRTLAGSARDVDLVVADPTVSRLHAEFEPTQEGCWIRDLGSTNGTFVENVRVQAALVPEGGRVRLGSTVITVRYAPNATAVDLWPEDGFGALVGRSVAARELFARLGRVAPADANVLIHGETGTGKELVARAIHDASPRARQPFVTVDCAALPEALLDSELSGHVKGAFTGAVSARVGALEAANGGTVFLDEIGELPLSMQPKLLRAIESRSYRRLGETEPHRTDVRFVSATHRDLRQMVNQGAFREDLYFRLAVLPVDVPPLRARADDIATLITHFLHGRAAPALDATLLSELSKRAWLGNVRELRNFVERALALGAREALDLGAVDAAARTSVPPTAPGDSRASSHLAPGDPRVSPHLAPVDPRASPHLAPDGPSPAALVHLPLRDVREQCSQFVEREYVRALIAAHRRNVGAMAEAAGVDRSYIHRLMRRYDL